MPAKNIAEVVVEPIPETILPESMMPVVEPNPIKIAEVIPDVMKSPVEQLKPTYQFELGAKPKFDFWEGIGKKACPRCGDKLIPNGNFCNAGFESGCPVIDGMV